MKKWVKRLSAMLLVIMMVLTLVPTDAYAAPGRGRHGGWRRNEVTEQTTESTVAEAVEEAAEEAVAAEPEEVQETVSMPAQNFNMKLEKEEIEVNVEAPEGAFPEGTTMEIAKPAEDDAAVAAAVNAVENAADVVAVDITFKNAAGEEIQPQTDIKVEIKTPEIVNDEDYAIVHVDDNNIPDVVKEEKIESINEEGAKFVAEAFSVYAVVKIVIPQMSGEFHGEENGVSVGVTVGEGAFSEPVILSVSAIDPASEDYAKAQNELANINQAYEGMVAFDICFTSAATGAEVEPAKAVDVKIEITDPEKAGVPAEALGALTITHILDAGGAEVVSQPAEESAPVEELADLPPVSDEFSAEVFSTYTISWGNRRYNIHYVDTNGASLTPTRTPEFSNGYKFLIYDVEGYEYDSTHYGSRTGTAIKPLLANYGNDRVYLDNNNNWQYLRNDVYVVYKAKATPTQGGTPQVDTDETWPEGADAPLFSKSSTNNGNGTNTISLDIKAAEKPVEKSTPADVIVVFDVSGSMSNDMNGQTRLDRAKTAVNTMANTLLNGNSDVRMSLISFSTDATTEQGFTGNYTTFSRKVNELEASGGTNWEKALQIANTMEVRDNAATFVVFVTDGDPTFRVSRGNVSDSDLDLYSDGTYQYYRNNFVFGAGISDDYGRNFNFAVDQVSAIAGANKNFYAIGISDDVTKVQNLTTQGGVAGDHAFIASDSTAMENAFKSITESIKAVLGFGDVQITDGITNLTNAEMKVMETVDPNSFKYYRYGGEGNKYGADKAHKQEWTTREADGCAAASYEDGAVKWNMGDSFQLEDGVTYVVEFNVWPSQEAYDLVADLNNGIKTYDSLTDAEKAQVVKLDTDPVTYALKTNTDEVNATYKKTTKSGDVVTVSDNTPVDATYHEGTIENMALESMKLTIKKEFEDDLTAGEDRETEVTLVLKRRNSHQTPEAEFEDYAVPQGGTTSANIVLNEGNNWTYELYVAPGLETDGKVLEHGYDFTITEPDIDYHYGLIEEVINPMIVDGEEQYYGDGKLLDGETVAEYTDRSLTAVNRVKSGIDIKKVVLDKDDHEVQDDTEYTITGKLLDADGHAFTWQEGDDVNASGAYHKYDKDGNRIVYKGHFADTSNISFTLKGGEYIRFINVPEGCTFEFTETPVPDGYTMTAEGVTQHRISAGGEFTPEGDVQPTVDNGIVSLTSGVVGNKQYSVTFTNKADHYLGNFYVYHSSDNTIEKISVNDPRVIKGEYNTETKTYNYSFNIVDETKNGYLYGGYYKAYGNQILDDAAIMALTYDNGSSVTEYDGEHSGGKWAWEGDGAVPYNGSKATAWKKVNAYTTDKGTEMHPELNKVYYLKEVPDSYARPYIQIVYDTYHKDENGKPDNPLVDLYTITAIDDGNYNDVGFIINGEKDSIGKLSSTLKITNPNKTSTLLTAKKIFNGKNSGSDGKTLAVPRGYLTSKEQKSLIAKDSFTMVPYFVTLDGVGVSVESNTIRTVTLGNKCFVLDEENQIGIAPGITTLDALNGPKYN